MLPTRGYAIQEPHAAFLPFNFEGRQPDPRDVLLKFFIVVFAIKVFIQREMKGVIQLIRWFLAMRLLDGSFRQEQQLINLKLMM